MKLAKSVGLTLALLLLNTVSLGSHASALSPTPHEMSGHGTSDSASCATQCRTAVFNKEEVIDSRYSEEDDEPIEPFYVYSQPWLFSAYHISGKLYADSVKPPPKIPIYILYGVFRD